VTAKACPAIVMVARREVPVLAATTTVTAPLPEPLLGPAKVIHGRSLTADHAQLPGAAIVTFTLWPSDGARSDAGLIANVQPCAAASCAMEMLCPAMSTVPDRPAPVLVATCRVRSALPVPFAEGAVIHDDLGTIVHVQNAWVVTVTWTSPPADPLVIVAGVTV
jgi:hypothetical protein